LESRQLLAFSLGLGSTGIDFGTGVVADAQGNTYVTGTFQGKVDFNPSKTKTKFLTAEGLGSSFVAKYTAAGGFAWARLLGSVTTTSIAHPGISGGIAIDTDGSVYTTGVFNATADFAPSTGIGGDIYLAKLDTNGNLIWNLGFGSTDTDAGVSVAVDHSHHVYLTGVFSDTVDFEPGKKKFNLTSQGLQDAFIAKYDGNGTLLWARGLGGNGLDAGGDMAINSKDQVFLVGSSGSNTVNYYAATNIQSNLLGQFGLSGAYMMKFSSAGSLLFSKEEGGIGLSSAVAVGVAVDPGDDVFMTGTFTGSVDFDPGAPIVALTASASDGFVQKLSGGAGNFLITKRIGGSGDDSVVDVQITHDGYVFVNGFYHGSAVTVSGSGSANLKSAGGADQFVAKFRISGKFMKAKSIGSTTDDWGIALALDQTHDLLYTTGFINGTTGVNNVLGVVVLLSGGDDSIYRTDFNLALV
jgi:hypothetical protein